MVSKSTTDHPSIDHPTITMNSKSTMIEATGNCRVSPELIRKTESLSVSNRMRLKKLSVFSSIKITQLLCVMYIMVLTFFEAPIGLVDPQTGKIIDARSDENTEHGVILINGNYRPVVASTTFQMICLAVSRISAFSLYPVMIAVFLSKCKAMTNYFSRTPLSLYMIQDNHELHAYAGRYIAFDVWIHTLFHLLRWGTQGNISLLWKTRTGLSGLIVIGVTPLITFPMMYWKKTMRYEIRKGLHYLFYAFAVGMCFHVPVSAIPNGGFIAPVLGFCICIYTLDALYVNLCMTEKIETTIFQVLPGGVKMSMDVSDSFQGRMGQGGFVYVCLPWVDRNQWHAFSLFENPSVVNRREVFMLNSGNWTRAVHMALQRDTVRPVWVQGPFESPYNNASMYDNQVLVATGIGIAPALSVILAHKDTRRINLIWAVRDAAMLEFFLEHLYLDHNGWNLIFYTGKAPLNPALEELNTNVRVIKERPDLCTIIPNIIYGIESGRGLPEKYIPSELARVKLLLNERTQELDENEDMTTDEKLKDLTALAHSCGFLFTELVNELGPDLQEEGIKNDIPISLAEQGHGGAKFKSDTDFKNIREGKGRASRFLSTLTAAAPFNGSAVLQKIRNFDDSCPSRLSSSSMCSYSSARMQRRGSLDYPPINPRRGSFEEIANDHRNRALLLLAKNNMWQIMTSGFKPWQENASAKEYVKKLDNNTVLSTWGILYCGGSASVERTLKRISEEYHVALNAETFDW